MNGYSFTLADCAFVALPSGALFAPEAGLLCVSDLHLGKSERMARRGGPLLPPYETLATLGRLEDLIDGLEPEVVICLGDSFDDNAAEQALGEDARLRIARMQAGRDWVWIEGNHDPAPTTLAGRHLAEFRLGAVAFRHIASDGPDVSGHYHPKAPGPGGSRACFLIDGRRAILPAFGAYTGGLSCFDPAFAPLIGPDGIAVLTGPRAVPLPLARLAQSRGSRKPASTRFGR